MSTDRPDGPPAQEPEPSGSGPMMVLILAFVLFCGGSIAGIAFVGWRMARTVQENEQAEEAEAARQNGQSVMAEHEQPFERVAVAVAEGLKNRPPLADSYTPDGKPLLSWRVHLLPRLGEPDLYQGFKLDEPWDGPANKKLLKQTPGVYFPPHPRIGEWAPGQTYIRAFSQKGAIFEPRVPFAPTDLSNGPDNTLAIFDSAEPVEWTRPDQLDWRDAHTRPRAGGSTPGYKRFLAAMASGRVVWIDKDIPAEVLRQISSRRHDPKWDEQARRWLH